MPSANSTQDVEALLTGSTALQQSSEIISSVGKKVKLTHCGRNVVLGTIMDGTVLHGMELPTGYVKVVVDEIRGNIIPPVKGKFTEEFIGASEIHAWPARDVILD